MMVDDYAGDDDNLDSQKIKSTFFPFWVLFGLKLVRSYVSHIPDTFLLETLTTVMVEYLTGVSQKLIRKDMRKCKISLELKETLWVESDPL